MTRAIRPTLHNVMTLDDGLTSHDGLTLHDTTPMELR